MVDESERALRNQVGEALHEILDWFNYLDFVLTVTIQYLMYGCLPVIEGFDSRQLYPLSEAALKGLSFERKRALFKRLYAAHFPEGAAEAEYQDICRRLKKAAEDRNAYAHSLFAATETGSQFVSLSREGTHPSAKPAEMKAVGKEIRDLIGHFYSFMRKCGERVSSDSAVFRACWNPPE